MITLERFALLMEGNTQIGKPNDILTILVSNSKDVSDSFFEDREKDVLGYINFKSINSPKKIVSRFFKKYPSTWIPNINSEKGYSSIHYPISLKKTLIFVFSKYF